ncbi:uncharacterized protein LOC119365549 [Triticum dicoccoides]|uniref:uncharacterized protein LOC119365549 n=1 Tax=Triticum dicoccoides TaxID=85692 RepID=UPI00188F7BD7|nr:uncharacterized protein LOC119365549 [Triticum dicoccoides]XP_044325946.1 uncharacterized protein LOC123046613 isoform X2 [Triticum aestivum]
MHPATGTFNSCQIQALLVQRRQKKQDGGCSGRPSQIPTSDAPSARAPLGDPLQFNSLATQYREDPLVHSVACRGHVDDGEKHSEVDVVQYLTVDFAPALHPQDSRGEERGIGVSTTSKRSKRKSEGGSAIRSPRPPSRVALDLGNIVTSGRGTGPHHRASLNSKTMSRHHF